MVGGTFDRLKAVPFQLKRAKQHQIWVAILSKSLSTQFRIGAAVLSASKAPPYWPAKLERRRGKYKFWNLYFE
jgi:hypothetical protein